MKNIIIIFILCLIFSNVFFINTNITLIGDGGDNYEYFGFMHLAKENILSGKNPFSPTDTLRYPTGFNFSYGYDGAFPVVTGAVFSIFMSPILAYNLTVVLIMFLNIMLSALFFNKIGKLYDVKKYIHLKSLIAGFIYGASPYVFARLNSHLNLSFIAGFPVIMYSLTKIYKVITQNEEKIPQRYIVLLFLGILLTALGSLQYLFMLIFGFLLVTPFFLTKDFIGKLKTYVRWNYKDFFVPILTFVFLFWLIFGPYFIAFITGNTTMVNAEGKFFKPSILDILLPNSYLGNFWSYFNFSEKSIERVITVGSFEVILLFYILFKLKNTKAGKIGLVLFLSYIIVSFGILNIPFIPEGGRTVILLSLFIAYCLLSYEELFKKIVPLLLMLTLLLVERLFFNLQTTTPLGAVVFSEYIRPLQGSAVLNIPLSKYDAYRSALPVFYNKKVLDGYFHYTAENAKSQAMLSTKLYERFICREGGIPEIKMYNDEDRIDMLNSLKMLDITSAVVFRDDIVGRFYHDSCDNVRFWWFWLNPRTVVLNQDIPDITKENFSLLKHNPHNLVRFYAEREGKLQIHSINISPRIVENLKLILPDNTVVQPDWKEIDNGYIVDFSPPIEVNLKPGQALYLKSDEIIQDNRYIFVSYTFNIDGSNHTKKKVPFELLFNDKEVEIYKINF